MPIAGSVVVVTYGSLLSSPESKSNCCFTKGRLTSALRKLMMPVTS